MSIHWDPMTHPNALTEAGYKETKLEYLYNVEVWHEKAFPQGRDGEPEPLTKKIMS